MFDLLCYLKKHAKESTEFIVADGGSCDQTLTEAKQAGVCCFVSPQKGRAAQMNAAAERASGDILYFVHADSLPPPTFIHDIKASVKAGHPAGCLLYTSDAA